MFNYSKGRKAGVIEVNEMLDRECDKGLRICRKVGKVPNPREFVNENRRAERWGLAETKRKRQRESGTKQKRGFFAPDFSGGALKCLPCLRELGERWKVQLLIRGKAPDVSLELRSGGAPLSQTLWERF